VLELAPGQIFASDFRVVRPLSKGGMGSVYVVEQISTELQRALKLMHPELVRDPRLRQRFEQEARIGGQIASDHIAQVISAGVDPSSGTPWLAMELLQGETLAEWIQRRRTSLQELFAIYGQLCHGLAAAHATGIVHRDLKPENIFVAVPRQAGLPFFIKVLDFGIAKMASRHGAGATTTSMGTPLWMAPEQTESGHVGPQTDVWALGLIAFSLLTQRTYWARGNDQDTTLPALMREILFEPLVPASSRARQLGIVLEAEQAFDAWFARCVAREPGARFDNAGEAHAALVSWLSHPGVPAATASATAAGYIEPVPPTVGTGTHLPGAVFSPPDPRFPGVTERGISETIGQKPRGKVAGFAALALVLLVAGGVLGWLKLRPAPAASTLASPEPIAATAPAGCPAGQARKDPAGACLCADGKPPAATGACVACSATADQAAIRGVLKDAEARARLGCHAASPGKDSGTITITIDPSGHVAGATIEGDLANSEGARCVSAVFLGTSLPCFSGQSIKLKKGITLETPAARP
jgi:eukaryotic-like serine/threonine-protein kinase